MRKPAILIADRDANTVKLLEMYLIPQGYEVTGVYSAQEVLRQISLAEFDLLLLDAEFSEPGAFETIRKIRENDTLWILPILLLCNEPANGIRTKALEADCDGIINKPIDKPELLLRVRSLLKLSRCKILIEGKDKYEYVLQHMKDGVVLLDKDLVIASLNQKAKDWLGIYDGDRTIDFVSHIRRFLVVHHDGHLNLDLKQKDNIFELERPETASHRPLVLSIRSSVIRTARGETNGAILVIHDVTEERKKQFAEHSFLDLMSHKLRTPMMVIDGYMSLLKDGCFGPLNKKQKETVDLISERSQDLMECFDKQLGLLALRDLKLDVATHEILLPKHLSNLIRGFEESLAKRFPGKKVEFATRWPLYTADETTISMNKTYFDLVIKNLIENAVKFNDNETVRIHVTLKKIPLSMAVLITDNGQGIPPEEKEKIFEPFYQIDKHRTGNIRGVGLGLTLVKNLMTAYGGSVQLESEIAKGSTFTLCFPLC